jgi:hypothetical protein
MRCLLTLLAEPFGHVGELDLQPPDAVRERVGRLPHEPRLLGEARLEVDHAHRQGRPFRLTLPSDLACHDDALHR